MNHLTRYILPALTFLLITLFFLLLPDLRDCSLRGEKSNRRLDRLDALLMAVVTLVYGVLAFTRLGDTKAPQSFVNMEGRTVELDLDLYGGTASHLMVYTGVGIGRYTLDYTTDGSDSFALGELEQSHADVLKWHDVDIDYYITGGTLCISGYGNVWLGEVVALTEEGEIVPLTSSAAALCDEQTLAPEKQNFLNSSYFDEIYHARTAWEHLNGVWAKSSSVWVSPSLA